MLIYISTRYGTDSTNGLSRQSWETWDFHGFASISGINALGEYKVGNVVGKFGDCQHFCQPGPPDEYARVFLQLFIMILEGNSTALHRNQR